jgi:pantothenate kinase
MTDSVQQLSLAPDDAVAWLADLGRSLVAAGRDRRVALGLAGGPGTGKSTLAAALVAALNADAPGLAALVPMDGFHMRHGKLEALGIVADKGAPHTFEGAAFARFLAQLRGATGPVSGPGYSRAIEDVVDGAFTVPGEARLLVVEGNYLLLPEPPWDQVRPLLDSAAFIDVPRETVRARLLRRHAEHGLFSEERNRAHVERVDLANYDLVAPSRRFADIVIHLLTES